MESVEKKVAQILLEIEAVQLNIERPFEWASGWLSPIYCDNRKVLSFPFIRDFIKSEMCNVIFEKFADAEILAAVATAGIAWGAMAADQLKLPFIYVRPKPKEHGLGNQIEGNIVPGAKVVVVEDLISTGKSSLQVCEVIKLAGMQVVGMVSLFTYGFEQARDSFEKEAITNFSLSNYDALLQIAFKKGLVTQDQFNSLLNWRQSPENWGK